MKEFEQRPNHKIAIRLGLKYHFDDFGEILKTLGSFDVELIISPRGSLENSIQINTKMFLAD